jgi:hypothetical protein
MSKKRVDQIGSEFTDSDQSGLKKAVIAFAIIEALVLIPVVLYLMLR